MDRRRKHGQRPVVAAEAHPGELGAGVGLRYSPERIRSMRLEPEGRKKRPFAESRRVAKRAVLVILGRPTRVIGSEVDQIVPAQLVVRRATDDKPDQQQEYSRTSLPSGDHRAGCLSRGKASRRAAARLVGRVDVRPTIKNRSA